MTNIRYAVLLAFCCSDTIKLDEAKGYQWRNVFSIESLVSLVIPGFSIESLWPTSESIYYRWGEAVLAKWVFCFSEEATIREKWRKQHYLPPRAARQRTRPSYSGWHPANNSQVSCKWFTSIQQIIQLGTQQIIHKYFARFLFTISYAWKLNYVSLSYDSFFLDENGFPL